MKGAKTVTFQWTKEICSMNSEDSDDVAEFTIFPNGDAFEKGEMPNPNNNNKVQAFEEVWGSLPTPASEQPAWVLRRKGDGEEGITYVGRIGEYYQILNKDGKGVFHALREEKVDGKWEKKYEIGGKSLLSIGQVGEEAFDARTWAVGEEVKVDGVAYSVLAVEKY